MNRAAPTLALVLVVVLAMARLAGQTAGDRTPPGVRNAAEAITAAKLHQDLTFLASEELKGRATPSAGLESATGYISKRLAAWGLRPAGDDQTFLQRYSVERHVIDTEASRIQVGSRTFRYGEDFVVRYAPRSVSMTAAAVWVGQGSVVRSRRVDPYAGLEHRDKVLLMWGPASLELVRGDKRLENISSAERADPSNVTAPWVDAKAVVFIPQFGTLADLWSATRRRSEQPPAADTRLAGAAPRETAWIYAMPSLIEALMVGEQIGAGELYGRSLAGDPPPSFALDVRKEVKIDIVVVAAETFRPANVVAIVEGSDPTLKEEYVTIQAHLDGVGGRAADDNASGAATLLGVAEALMRGPRPKRSVLLLWDSGEERRAWGTRHFVAHPPVPLERVIAHVNVDMVGRAKAPGDSSPANAELTGPNEVYVVGPRAISSGLDELVESVNAGYLKLAYNHRYDTWNSPWLHPRADHVAFLEKHIPLVFFFTGEHADYHQPTDTSDKIDYLKLERIARSVLATTWAIANMPSRPVADKPWPEKLKLPR